MILVWVTCLGVASALFTRTRWRRLAALPIRHLWLIWLAVVVQVLLFEYFGHRIPVPVSDKIHLGTYALALTFLWLNRRLPGGWLIALGTSFNLVAIVANNGSMPANMTAWHRAGLAPISPEVFENSRALSSPRLAILGDVFYVPASWPFSNVFSIGDVLIVLSSVYLAHRWCSQPRGSELATTTDAGVDDVHDVHGADGADRADDADAGMTSTGAHELV